MPDQHSPSVPPPGAAPEPPRPDSRLDSPRDARLDSRSGSGSASGSASGPAPGSVPERTPARKYVENKPPRGLYVRVFIYVIATHVLLAFMSLLVVIAKTR
ncbi:DUF6126 family protein [Streptomyces sp. NPDC101393]|uniref:DUF6126 family protein n=1 Tax=Streptomyces sp. NPDC101393 TaxID=3366141 RepID=UPI00381FA8EC